MSYAERLGYCESIKSLNYSTLHNVFQWFIDLNIIYETASNFQKNILIKNAEQMVDALADGFGGHCVEHAVLLTTIFCEMGFAAKLINADYHDYRKNVHITMAKPLTLVSLSNEIIVCDSYYRRLLLPVPKNGKLTYHGHCIKRINSKCFAIQAIKDGKIVNEDMASENYTIETRQKQFDDRYAAFFPFGVTAPYYQLLHPIRKALYYVPQKDKLLVIHNNNSYYIDDSDVDKCEWIPENIRLWIPKMLCRNRNERNESIAFLRTGIYQPNYKCPDT